MRPPMLGWRLLSSRNWMFLSSEQKRKGRGGVTIKITCSHPPPRKGLATRVPLMSTMSKTKRATTCRSPQAAPFFGPGAKSWHFTQQHFWGTMICHLHAGNGVKPDCSLDPLVTPNHKHSSVFINQEPSSQTVKVTTHPPHCSHPLLILLLASKSLWKIPLWWAGGVCSVERWFP